MEAEETEERRARRGIHWLVYVLDLWCIEGKVDELLLEGAQRGT